MTFARDISLLLDSVKKGLISISLDFSNMHVFDL